MILGYSLDVEVDMEDAGTVVSGTVDVCTVDIGTEDVDTEDVFILFKPFLTVF